jgi:hypothetical protein
MMAMSHRAKPRGASAVAVAMLTSTAVCL